MSSPALPPFVWRSDSEGCASCRAAADMYSRDPRAGMSIVNVKCIACGAVWVRERAPEAPKAPASGSDPHAYPPRDDAPIETSDEPTRAPCRECGGSGELVGLFSGGRVPCFACKGDR